MKPQYLLASILLLSSCGLTGSDPGRDKGDYTVAFTAQGSAGESTDYLFNTPDLSAGTLSAAGVGIEQTGWRYMYGQDETVFSVGYYDDNNAIAYRLNGNGRLAEAGRFVFENTLDMFGRADANTMLAMEVPRIGFADRVLHVVDVNSVSIRSKHNLRIWESRTDSLVAWPTALKVRGDKLFISFYKIHARGDFSTPRTDTAFVAVYSWPGLQFDRYLTDARMGPLGVYGLFNGLVSDEAGNLYGYSSASRANGFTTQQKRSGILRIPAGSVAFDPAYYFDVETAAGGKINFLDYVGNGKAVANIVTDDSAVWGSFSATNEIHKLVVLDLVNRTSVDVSGVPLHGGFYGRPWLVEGNTVHMSVTTATGAAVYSIDVTTATGRRGATIAGKELKGIYRLNDGR
jgi:hypothetical protein